MIPKKTHIVEVFSPDTGRGVVEFSASTDWIAWLMDQDPDLDALEECEETAMADHDIAWVGKRENGNTLFVGFDVSDFDPAVQRAVADWLFYWSDPFDWSAIALARSETDRIVTQIEPRESATNPWWHGRATQTDEKLLNHWFDNADGVSSPTRPDPR